MAITIAPKKGAEYYRHARTVMPEGIVLTPEQSIELMWMEKTYDRGPYPVTFHVRFSRLASTTNQGLHVFAIENDVGLEILAKNPYLTTEMATVIYERVINGGYPVDDKIKKQIISNLFSQPAIYFNQEAVENMMDSGLITNYELQEAMFFHQNTLFKLPLEVFLIIGQKTLAQNSFEFLTEHFVEVIHARENEIKLYIQDKHNLVQGLPLSWLMQTIGIPLPKQGKAA